MTRERKKSSSRMVKRFQTLASSTLICDIKFQFSISFFIE